ncbi:MAG TPA: vWA domain-containing protein [Planctomycetota bacterium]|nr:vWA domain-containing protein [Planctomycetota bacterium]
MLRATTAFAAAAALAFAAAAIDPPIGGAGPRTRAIAIDRSWSAARRIGATWSAAVAAGAEGLEAGDRVAVLAFGGRARVVRSLAPWTPGSLPPAPDDGELDAGETDLAAAAQAARDAIGAGEVVLVTDGRATRGGRPATESLVAVDPPGRERPNSAISAIRAPLAVVAGAPFRVRVDVATTRGARPPSAVELRARGESRSFPLRELGEGRVGIEEELSLEANEEILAVDARLVPGDAFPEDDSASAVVHRAGRIRVGVAGGAPAFATALARRPELDVVELKPADLATPRPDLQVLFCIDLDREALGPALPALGDAVRSGTGLLWAGARRAFAFGGIERSDLGAMLPLEPAIAGAQADDLLVLLDASGSMAGEKLARARGGARALVTRIQPGARVRVAWFARGIEGVADLATPGALSVLDAIEARGETDLDAAIRDAQRLLDREGARRRLFLVSDGLERGARAPLAAARAIGERLAAAGIEPTAFAVGADADLEFLAALTLDGRNGRALPLPNAASLDEALVSEAAASALVGGGNVIVHAADAPIGLASLPPVRGAARVRPRAGAIVLASVEGGAPLLAWSPGLRLAALAVAPGSDLAPGWEDRVEPFVAIAGALAPPLPLRRAWREGDAVSLDDPRAGDAGSRTLVQGGRSHRLWRVGASLFRGEADGLASGWARVVDDLGVEIGAVAVERATPIEASPDLPALALPGLRELPARPAGASARPWLFALGSALLLAAAAASRSRKSTWQADGAEVPSRASSRAPLP